MSNVKLDPCPFCGGEVILDKEDIFCDECNLSMKIYTRLENKEAETYEEAREQTIEAWNTRKPMDRIVEQLEKLRQEYPYKVVGEYDTYSTYNEAWSYCSDRAIAIVKGVQNE